MQAGHRLGHRFAGLVSDALIFVRPVCGSACTARYFGAQLDDGSLTPGDSPRLLPTRVEDWPAVHKPERSFS
jgi:hypothetical protein